MKKLAIAAVAALFAFSVSAAEKPAEKAAEKAASAAAGTTAKQIKEDSDKQASAEKEEAAKAQ